MAFGLIFCSVILCSNVVFGAVLQVGDDTWEDFYWRDYDDKIPKDALPGGHIEETDQKTYIGQIVYSSVLLPGELVPDEGRMYYSWDYGDYSTTENIKVLCTPHPEKFEWLKTNTKAAQSLRRKRLVLGGFRSGYTIFIGRAKSDQGLTIGKVELPNDGTSPGRFKMVVNGSTETPNEFEILNYQMRRPAPNKKGAASDLQSCSVFILLALSISFYFVN